MTRRVVSLVAPLLLVAVIRLDGTTLDVPELALAPDRATRLLVIGHHLQLALRRGHERLHIDGLGDP